MSRMVFCVLFLPVFSFLAGCDSGTGIATFEVRAKTVLSWFTEPAYTRFAEVHSVFMPVAGDVSRIELLPGDEVRRGDALATVDDTVLRLAVKRAEAAVHLLEGELAVSRFDDLEVTAKAELTATVVAARDVLRAAAAQVDAEKMRTARAQRELQRVKRLAATDSVSDQALDDASVNAEVAEIDLRQQEFTLAAFKTLLAAVNLGPQFVENWLTRKRLEEGVLRDRLAGARIDLDQARYELRRGRLISPADGVILERLHRGGGFVPAGTLLVAVGVPARMEAVAEVLTEDAMGLAKGVEVELSARGGLHAIAGRISRIQPLGFTKRSALGVDQQRVRVIISLGQTPPALGAGYRLRAKFITAKRPNALSVPRFSVLQDQQGRFYVFKEQGGRMERVDVVIKQGNDLEMVVQSGLQVGDRIVHSPDTEMRDGDPL